MDDEVNRGQMEKLRKKEEKTGVNKKRRELLQGIAYGGGALAALGGFVTAMNGIDESQKVFAASVRLDAAVFVPDDLHEEALKAALHTLVQEKFSAAPIEEARKGIALYRKFFMENPLDQNEVMADAIAALGPEEKHLKTVRHGIELYLKNCGELVRAWNKKQEKLQSDIETDPKMYKAVKIEGGVTAAAAALAAASYGSSKLFAEKVDKDAEPGKDNDISR